MVKTAAEQVLSRASGEDAHAGDIVVCNADLILGTDASAPMAISYFERMGGSRVHDPARVAFALDHYDGAIGGPTAGYHDAVHAFAARTGVRVFGLGEGISHQVAVERAMVRPGQLVVGADSHTVTCGAINAFATGIGSSDLAAALISGRIWLRVPESIRIELEGRRPPGLAAKDIALAILGLLGADGANYCSIEFTGEGVEQCSIDDRLVLCNMMVECGAKSAIFPFDRLTSAWLRSRGVTEWNPVSFDSGATISRTIPLALGALGSMVARPHAPDNVSRIAKHAGTPVQMVFLGTCTGGRAVDFHEALEAIELGGGRVAPGVQLVVTPASAEVQRSIETDGTLDRFRALGAVVTTPGCGACCGTSGVIPTNGMTVVSTANRNFKARMGNATASIWLASPAACGAAAAAGRLVDPGAIAASLEGAP